MDSLFPVFAFGLGAIIGSFLNVVIHRYPAGQSLVFPGSYCPNCKKPIRGYDNIPIFSYLVLGGKCRYCRNPISARYPLVELANALFYVATYLHTGIGIGFVLVCTIVSMTIVLIYIDLDIQILPDVIDLPGIALGLLLGYLQLGALHSTLVLATSFVDSLVGAALGAATLLVIGAAYQFVRKIEGMGLGDVKMLAMIGAIVGWRPLLPLLFGASAAGAVLGVALAARSERGLKLPIPFGVFLGLSTLAVIFTGHDVTEWYRSLLID